MKLEGFSNYEIDVENGTVYSLKRNRFIGNQHPNGYWQITLMGDDHKEHHFMLHRVIWMAVNGDIPEGMEINHLDEDKSNNSISNLNLVTPKENMNWGTCIQRRVEKQRKKVVALDNNGNTVLVFESTREAERNGYCSGAVSACCNGKQQSHKGYQWKFLN